MLIPHVLPDGGSALIAELNANFRAVAAAVNALGGGGGTTFATVSLLGQSADVPQTTLFTAPADGVYLISAAAHVTATDGTGSFGLTVAAGPRTGNAFSFTCSMAFGVDSQSTAYTCWLNAGEHVTIAATGTNIVASTFDVYLTTAKVL